MALADFIFYYPVYAVLFAQHGLSTSQISSLFVIWSATAVLLEVPSGALADVVSRRVLLVASALLSGGGFAAWTLFPSYPAFAVGFVLWGVGSSLSSGTYEAYVYDELVAHDAVRSYQRIIARGRAGSFVLNLAATLLAAVLLPLGGFALVGWASVATCVVQAAVALSLPTPTRARSTRTTGYVGMLRSGLREARHSVPVRGAVLVAALLPGFLAFDEYFPLLATDLGSPTDVVPLLIALTVAAQAVGAALAERARAGVIVPSLVLAAVLLGAGALSAHPAGFVPIAVGYGLLQLTIVIAETRLQDLIEGDARATVTSVAGLLSELFAILLFVGFAVGAIWLSVTVLVAALAGWLLLLAALLPRWLPSTRRLPR